MRLYAIRRVINGQNYYLWADYDADISRGNNVGDVYYDKKQYEYWNTNLHDCNLGSYLPFYEARVPYIGGEIVTFELKMVTE